MSSEPKDVAGKLFVGSTPYDVLGYVAPGGALILCCFLFEFWIRRLGGVGVDQAMLPVYSLIREVTVGLDHKSWAVEVMFVVVAVGTIYVVGHVVASIGAILIERQLVQHGHGYPLQRFLGIDSSPTTPISRSFCRAFFFWLNVYLMIRYAEIAAAHMHGYAIVPPIPLIGTCISWLLVVLVIGKVVLSSKYFLPYVHGGKFTTRPLKILGMVYAALSLPYDLIVNPISKSLHLHSKFPVSTIEAFKKFMESRFSMKAESWGSEAYWQAYLEVRRSGPIMSEPADNWLRLYSFSRNLSAALFLAYLYCYALLALNDVSLPDSEAAQVAVFIPIGFLAGALIMLCRYYYLYAAYYTKYLVRACVNIGSHSSSTAAP